MAGSNDARARKGNKHATNSRRRDRKAARYTKKKGNRIGNSHGVVESTQDIRKKKKAALPIWHGANTGHPRNPEYGRRQRALDDKMIDWIYQWCIRHQKDSSPRVQIFRDLRHSGVDRQTARDVATRMKAKNKEGIDD
jgi:hypothetical protein